MNFCDHKNKNIINIIKCIYLLSGRNIISRKITPLIAFEITLVQTLLCLDI